MSGEDDRIRSAVAATLRIVAGWGDVGAEELYRVADQVETLSDETLAWVCPVCEEVLCDDDCPLFSVRQRLNPSGDTPVTL